MKERILSVIVAVTMLMSLMTVSSNAAAGDPDISALRSAFDAVTDAVDEMEALLGKDQTSTLSKIFSGFVGTARNASSVFGMVNGGVTFLRLTGLLKDPNAERMASIQHELKAISDKMAEMDRKIDSIAESVTALAADQDYKNRMSSALSLKTNWRGFRRDYLENGLDKSMSDYNGMILNGLKAWMLNESADSRTSGGVDNASITVIYAADDDGSTALYLTDKKAPPADVRVTETFVLTADEIPGAFEFDANTNETRLTETFASLLAAKYPERSKEQISDIAADMYATLVYRIASKEVNKDATFSLNIARNFDLYCEHLFDTEQGLDAYLKALYLTHAFEFEISDELTGICNRMILETATYGAFVSNVLTMSGFTTDADLNTRLSELSETILALDHAKSVCVTGKPGFCYITNCEVVYTCDEILMSAEYKVRTQPIRDDPATSTYLSGKLFPTKVMTNMTKPDSGLIGDKNALLLFYMLRGNGIEPSHEFFYSKIGDGRERKCSSILTSRKSQTTLGFGESVQMEVYPLIGKYFKGKSGGNLNFTQLPSKCDDDDFTFRIAMKGSLLDMDADEVRKDCVLAAMAGYAESHMLWSHDEVAFLCGPYSTEDDVMFVLDENLEYYGVAHIGYDHTDTLYCGFYFNTLHCVEPVKGLMASRGYDPLDDLLQINEDLGVERSTVDPESEGEEISQESAQPEKIDLGRIIGIAAAAVVVIAGLVTWIVIRKKKHSKQKND